MFSSCLHPCLTKARVYIIFAFLHFIAEAASRVSSDLSVKYDVSKTLGHFTEPYDYRLFGKLTVEEIEATPTSLLVRWTLSNVTYQDSIVESTLICETANGRIVSDKVVSSKPFYRVDHLTSDTDYIVCIYVLEKSKEINASILHYGCWRMSTIPYVRADSVIAVILTLGYLFLMGAIGYFTWRRQARRMSKDEEKDRVIEVEADEEDEFARCNGQHLASGSRIGAG